MADDEVYIQKISEAKIKVHAPRDILEPIAGRLEFYVEGYKFNPKYRQGIWDGKIRLLSAYSGLAPTGLFSRISRMLEEEGIEHSYDPELDIDENVDKDIAMHIAKECESLFTPREYQNVTVYEGLSRKRVLILSPTGSGKSFSIFLLNKYFEQNDMKTLIVVPRKALAKQLQTDYIDYQGHHNGTQVIQSGLTKDVSEMTCISTWQSIHKMDADWFKQFDSIIVDEAHEAKAKSLSDIMNKCTHIEYRIGLTGTTDDKEENELTLEGHFGPKIQVAKTHELISKGVLASLLIKVVEIDYDDVTCSVVSKMKNFASEKAFLANHKERNDLISGLACSQSGNVLVLVEGRHQLDHLVKITKERTKREVFVIHGGIPVTEREKIRVLVESMDNVLLFATYGSFSVGSNIKKLDKAILATSFKSKIRILQSIGRTLRIGNGSDSAVVYDLTDNLTHKGKPNFTYSHSLDRLEHYVKERMKWKTLKVKITTST